MSKPDLAGWYTDPVMPPISLYIHIPFCAQRCSYCDFNTYAGLNSLIPEYVDSLCREIRLVSQNSEEPLHIHTIYFGGGTPSLLNEIQIEKIFECCTVNFNLLPELEVSFEANPGTLSQPYLRNLHRMGINRLSLGVQSSHPAELQLLGRIHSYPEVLRCFAWARTAGFENINLDLIFGLPDQKIQNWEQTLRLAAGLKSEHLSLYSLTVEESTPLGRWVKLGLLPLPDPDMAADMYELASDFLESDGFLHYEISNWAHGMDSDASSRFSPPEFASRHNLQYWHNNPYIGIGAGAHGYIQGCRTENVAFPAEYIKRLAAPLEAWSTFPGTPATHVLNPIDRAAEIGETMIMGLRLLREGISAQKFKERFGTGLESLFGDQIAQLQHLSLIERIEHESDCVVRLSKRGHLLANQVFIEFI